MSGAPADLVGLEGLRELAGAAGPLFTGGDDDLLIRERLAAALGVLPAPLETAAHAGRSWTRDGVDGVELSWATGIGGPTTAWMLRPAGETAALAGVVALHCHGGVKRWGKEKIADGPDGPAGARIRAIRDELYEGRAYADDLARSGFAVLVPDAFGWGSRRRAVTAMPWRSRRIAELELADAAGSGDALADDGYDAYAGAHEDALAKLLGVVGTSWGGVVVREDLLAVTQLARRPDVRPGGVGVVGLSGGGARAALVGALSDDVAACAVVAMMSTMDAVLDGYLHHHTWMLMNPGLGRVADWPEIAASRRPRPLRVVFAEQDALFPDAGMRAADEILARRYAAVGAAASYSGRFVPVPHSFDVRSQTEIARWFADHLGVAA